MYRKIVLIIFVLFIPLPLNSQEVKGNKKIIIEESVVSVKTPYTYDYTLGPNQAPYTLSKGMFCLDFVMYSQGSVSTKLYVGIWDFFTIGIFEDIQGVIGSSDVSFSIPLALLKINIINEINDFSLSLAVDVFSYGISTRAFSSDYYSRNLYGLHVPASFRYKSFFDNYSDIVFGLKFPLLPVGDVSLINTSLFLSTYIKFSEVLTVSFGIDNLFVSAERVTNSSIFSEIKFSPIRSLGISLIMNYSFIPSFERMIRIQYLDTLF
ncbi:MAG: hypothetical protein N2712_04825 [Brevinematales bacterium]|nr:hypothetical protein [Brevinematales bacterium]